VPPRLTRSLYLQVLVAVAIGVVIGHVRPDWGQALKPLGDGFIKLVKMLITPIIFSTVVVGIARMADLRKVGRVGWKAFVYFEALTTAALMIGIAAAVIIGPGRGINADPATLDARGLESFTAAGRQMGVVDFLLGIIPTTVVDAFAKGDMLQVLLIALLFGAALARMGEKSQALVTLVDSIGHACFGIVAIIMRLAPLGAAGAMAFTVGKYGVGSLLGLGKLMLTFYLTSLLFVLVVLGAVARWTGFNIVRFIGYLREEIFLVLGTSSSETALPGLMVKLETLGCSKSTVGLVIPMGYSFNLDGTSIYLTLATLFLSQALNIALSPTEVAGLLGVLLLTSKGAAAVTGGGFITLAATLSSTGRIPVAGLALLLGIDRFMSEARAITNLIGNAVAAVVIAKWEGELDHQRLRETLAHPLRAAAVVPAAPRDANI
jgi:aerobic C4-dicarboxylate transport protein